jgi:hypothetical protein
MREHTLIRNPSLPSRPRRVPPTWVELKVKKGSITPAQGQLISKSGRIHPVIADYDANCDEDVKLLPFSIRNPRETKMNVSIHFIHLYCPLLTPC